MEPHVHGELSIARKVAFVGAILVTGLTVVSLPVPVITFLAYRAVGATEAYPGLWWARNMMSNIFALASVYLLSRFLWLFSSRYKPNFRKLRFTLTASGLCLMAKQLCSYNLTPFTREIEVVSAPVSIGLSPSGSSFNTSNAAMVVFVLCVAALLRYVDALREDSDSIA